MDDLSPINTTHTHQDLLKSRSCSLRMVGYIALIVTMITTASVVSFPSLSFAQAGADEEVYDDKRGDFAVPQATLDQAEAAFFSGFEAYRAKRYQEAVEHFTTAHKLVPYRDLIFNIARSYEQLGNKTQAIVFYKKYLETKPIDETQIIHRLRQLGVSRFETPPPDLQSTSTFTPPPVSKSEDSSSEWLTWTALGTGGTLVALSVYFGLSALDDAETARNAMDQSRYDRAKSDAESNALIADISLTLGVAATAWGIYLLITDDQSPQLKKDIEASQSLKDSASSVRVTLKPTHGGGALGISGSF